MANVETLAGERVEEVLSSVVAELAAQGDGLATPLCTTDTGQPLPSRSQVIRCVELLRAVVFPGYFGDAANVTKETLPFHLGAHLDRIRQILVEQIRRGLCFVCRQDGRPCTMDACQADANRHAATLVRALPEIRRRLALDAVAAFEGDPAATSPAETIFCYPGVTALTSHRIAHQLHLSGVPIIPRIIAEHAHSSTGIDIHPGARIGGRMFIDHGTGVVIGETCEIGDNVRIYQGVTLGARRFPLDERGRPVKGIQRHPIVEDDVTIYSGATILGRVRIGKGSVIGGNVWLTRSVPPGSKIVQARPSPETFSDGGGI